VNVRCPAISLSSRSTKASLSLCLGGLDGGSLRDRLDFVLVGVIWAGESGSVTGSGGAETGAAMGCAGNGGAGALTGGGAGAAEVGWAGGAATGGADACAAAACMPRRNGDTNCGGGLLGSGGPCGGRTGCGVTSYGDRGAPCCGGARCGG